MTREEYQRKAELMVAHAINVDKLRRVIVCMPTGSGKTHVIARMILRLLRANKRVVVLATGVNLIDQLAERLRACGIDCGVVMSGRPRTESMVQVCSADTIRAMGSAPDADVVITDECHHDGALNRKTICDSYGPNIIVVGFTASPERGDGVSLGEGGARYQRILTPITIAELQALWHASNGREGLVPIHTYSTPTLKPRTKQDGWCEDPLAMYQRLCSGSQMVAFWDTVEQSERESARFNAAGISSVSVKGGVDRTVDLARFDAREFKVIHNVGCLTEGWDSYVETVGVFCGVSFFGAWLQRIGRGARPAEGKTHCTVLDPYGHIFKGWSVDIPRAWTLDGTPSRPVEYCPPLQQCKRCGCVAAPGKACVRCGEPMAEYIGPKAKKELARLVEVHEIRQRHARMCADWDSIVREARAKKHDMRSCFYRFQERWGQDQKPPYRVEDVKDV